MRPQGVAKIKGPMVNSVALQGQGLLNQLHASSAKLYARPTSIPLQVAPLFMQYQMDTKDGST